MTIPYVITVSGPTASGKSALALWIAQQLAGEIISVDSVQVYKGFNIGSAKASKAELKEVKHHLIDQVGADGSYNVGSFIKDAIAAIADIKERLKVPILVGGTTMYISSLFCGLSDLPPASHELRASFVNKTNEELWLELSERDLERAKILHINDRQRIERALEINFLSGGGAIMHPPKPFVGGVILIMCWDREVLYSRINRRVNLMLEGGLKEETAKIVKDFGFSCQALKTLGYAECVQNLKGELPDELLAEKIAQHTRNYAKRQMTYFLNEPRKRGWVTLPIQQFSEDKDNKRADLIKVFCTLDYDRKTLLNALSNRLLNPGADTEVWYLDAEKFGV